MPLKLLAAVLIAFLMASCTLDLRGNLPPNDARNDSDIITEQPIDIDVENSDVQCTSHVQCVDDKICNGQEYCGIDGLCIAGTPLPDGNECFADPRSICISGICQISICGDGVTDEPKGEQCDDGNLIPGDGCENNCTLTNECTADDQCNDGHDCTTDRCDPDLYICHHTTRATDFLCRPSTGQCDLEEYCDGISPDCPTDQFSPPGSPCNDANPCTHPDECNGTGVCTGTNTNLLYDVISITSGYYHTCAVLLGGGIKCWGYNAQGQLGDGTIVDSMTPKDVFGITSEASQTALGEIHTCATFPLGSPLCWGYNGLGQLGNETTTTSYTPVVVTGVSIDANDISSGSSHTCVVLATRNVKCWGSNNLGQLGDGSTDNSLVPHDVEGLSIGISSVSCGYYHSCALTETGGVKCWGSNNFGQLGDATTIDKLFPTDVTSLSSGVQSISAGDFHTCALLESGDIKCWGQNTYGQLGDATTAGSVVPVNVAGLTSMASKISSGGSHTCAVLEAGNVKCWGYNNLGQLGDSTNLQTSVPVDVVGLALAIEDISAGLSHTCAITDETGLTCWGNNSHGQLGDGTNSNKQIPANVLCR